MAILNLYGLFLGSCKTCAQNRLRYATKIYFVGGRQSFRHSVVFCHHCYSNGGDPNLEEL